MNENTWDDGGSSQQAEERALLDRVALRERDAFAELYRRYHGRLFKFIYRMTRSHTASDELVNDIMLVVWTSAARFRGDSRVSTWIFGIAYRQTLKRLSKKQVSVAPDSDPDDFADRQTSNPEQQDWIRHALDTLPAAQRLAMFLVFYVGLSYEEVAEVTECPVNTVKTRMFHARKKLKEQLRYSANAASDPGGVA